MNIGQIVKIKNFDDLPMHLQTQKYRGLAGFGAEIIDRLYSEVSQTFVYTLRLTGAKTIPAMSFPEEALEVVVDDPAEYTHEIEYLDGVVLAIFYEIKNGKKTEIARGHGHIIHEGALGIAQATSYAMKQIYYQINDSDDRRANY